MKRAILCVSLAGLLLAACSEDPLGRDIIAQARPDGRIAFDVVKIDDAVLTALLAQPQPGFPERFKKHLPPPDLKIAVGDTVSVMIWESAANGLFGNSLTELSFPAGTLSGGQTSRSPALAGISSRSQGLTASRDTLGQLFGGALGQGGTLGQGGAFGQGGTVGRGLTEQTGTVSSLPSTPGYDGLSGGTAAGSAGGTAPGLSGGTATALSGGTAADRAGGSVAGRDAGTTPGQRQSRGTENLAEQQFEELLKAAVQSGRPGTRIPDQQVASDGAISIPYAGRIAVAGRTAAEVQRSIEERLGPKALDPQALVIAKRSSANSVSVAGEVIAGARVPLSAGGDRLLQVIGVAGGAKAPLHETFVRLSRDGVTTTVPLATLVADPAQDIFAEPGDVLTLVRRPQTFSIFGATGKNTAITFNSDRLSLTEALAKAGGLRDDRADPRAVFLFRQEPVEIVQALGQPIATGAQGGRSPIVYRLDLKEANAYLLARRFAVRDKDIIFVANAETQPIYYFFRALAQLTGPIQTELFPCYYAKC